MIDAHLQDWLLRTLDFGFGQQYAVVVLPGGDVTLIHVGCALVH